MAGRLNEEDARRLLEEDGQGPTQHTQVELSPRHDESEECPGSSLTSCASSCSSRSPEINDGAGGDLRAVYEDLEDEGAIHNLVSRIGTSRRHWVCVGILGLANAADAVEVLAIGYIVTVFKDPVSGKPIDELSIWSALLTSAVFVGMLLGGLASGSLGDRFGRQPLLSLSLGVNASAALTSAMTPLLPATMQVPWLVFFRFIGGLGVGGSVPSAFALASELGPDATRSLFINAVAAFWSVGVLYTSLCAYILLHGDNGASNWPWFAALVSVPGLLAAVLCFSILEESPIFLWESGNFDKLKSSLFRFVDSRRNLHDDELVRLRREVEQAISKKRSENLDHGRESSVMGNAVWYNMGKLFAYRSIRRKTILVASIYFFLSFAHYGISSWISDLFSKVHFSDPYITSVFYTLATVPGLVMATILVDRLGRRTTTAGSMVLAFLSALMFALNTTNRSYVQIFAAFFNCFAACTWNAFDVFSAETFPSHLRGTGLGFGSACGRVGSIFANIFNGIVLASGSKGDADDAMHVAIVLTSAALSMLCGAIAARMLPETFAL